MNWKDGMCYHFNLSNWSRWELLTWNRTKWINDNINSGFLNQKRSSRGFSFAPTECPVRPAVSKAKVAITCCSFAPTRRTSCPWCETLEKPNTIARVHKALFTLDTKFVKCDQLPVQVSVSHSILVLLPKKMPFAASKWLIKPKLKRTSTHSDWNDCYPEIEIRSCRRFQIKQTII